MSKFHPYQTSRSFRRGHVTNLAVIPPKSWTYTPGRFVAFGPAAEENPESGDIIYRYQSSAEPAEESFQLRNGGPTYYRFRCTPLACGNPACQGQTKVMTSFSPPEWNDMHGFETYGNPFDMQWDSGRAFFVVHRGQLVWNTFWGVGPPEGWGHSVGIGG